MAKKLNSNLREHFIWFVPGIAVTLGILALSTFLSSPLQMEGVEYFDKIQHCFAYFVLVLSFLIAYFKAGFLTKKRTYQILILSSIYGFSLELVQYLFFAHRYFEWLDACANILGAILGFGIFRIFKRVK